MRTKKVSRYWCDHCNKAGLSASHMTRHEKHCTLNPSRACKCCVLVADLRESGFVKKTTPELAAVLQSSADVAKLYIEHRKTMWRGTDADESLLHNLGSEFDAEIKAALPALKDATGHCSVCVFAAIRQSGIPPSMVEGFDLKTEMRELFSDLDGDPIQGIDY